MQYVRGDRFGTDFTQRRAHSLHRFLKRLTLHPVLRRAALLLIFLETQDWNQQMRGRTSRGASLSEAPSTGGGSGGIVDTVAESLINTFTKPHKPDKRFIEVSERASKLTDDLSGIDKVSTRVVRREHELETDYADLAVQCQKLIALEPGVESTLTSFASSVATTSQGFKALKEHTDQDYLTSLKDMDNYVQALKNLLKTRESKQIDFEALTDYLARTATERDSLASAPLRYLRPRRQRFPTLEGRRPARNRPRAVAAPAAAEAGSRDRAADGGGGAGEEDERGVRRAHGQGGEGLRADQGARVPGYAGRVGGEEYRVLQEDGGDVGGVFAGAGEGGGGGEKGEGEGTTESGTECGEG